MHKSILLIEYHCVEFQPFNLYRRCKALSNGNINNQTKITVSNTSNQP